jgi:hypothetical protein
MYHLRNALFAACVCRAARTHLPINMASNFEAFLDAVAKINQGTGASRRVLVCSVRECVKDTPTKRTLVPIIHVLTGCCTAAHRAHDATNRSVFRIILKLWCVVELVFSLPDI